MAIITRENIGILNDKLSVTIGKDDYYTLFEKALTKYSKSANMHGFRKGMVPAGLIKKMYGPSIMTEEVIKVVEKELQQYLINENLNIFAQPLPLENDYSHININNPVDYTFHFELGLKPSLELDDIVKKAHLTRYTIEITENMINEEIQRIQENFASNRDEEKAATPEHIMNMHFEETDIDGNNIANGLNEKLTLKVSDFNANAQDKVIEKKKGDLLNIDSKKDIDFTKRAWMAKQLGIDLTDENAPTKYYKVTIENIFLREKAMVNEDLFKKLYPDQHVASETDFRKHIKDDIQTYWNNQSNQKLYDDLYHYLIEHTHVTLPETFLKRWLQSNNENKEKNPQQIEEGFPKFLTQLKWTLISDQLVQANNIKVSLDEVQKHITQQVINYYRSMGLNLNDQEDWLAGYINKLMQDRERIDGAHRQLQDMKLFEILGQQIETTEQIISQKDFEKIVKEHKH